MSETKPSPYAVQFEGGRLDPYRIMLLYGITHPAHQHAIKKLLRAGKGSKSMLQDIEETIESLKRWQEMIREDFKPTYGTGGAELVRIKPGYPAIGERVKAVLDGCNHDATVVAVLDNVTGPIRIKASALKFGETFGIHELVYSGAQFNGLFRNDTWHWPKDEKPQ